MTSSHRSSSEQDAPLCPWAEAARRFRDRLAIQDPTGRSFTWTGLHRAIERVRGRFEGLAVDTVALVVTNSPADVILLVAALRHGLGVALFGPRTPSAALEADLDTLGALLMDASWVEPVVGAQAGAASVAPIRLTGHTLIRTSGSTGNARWIRHSAQAHMASAATATRRLGLTEQDAWGWCLPMHHVGGLSVLWRCAATGASVLCPPHDRSLAEWVVSGAFDALPTHVSMVPTQLRDLIEQGDPSRDHLRTIIVGGAHVSVGLLTDAVQAGWPVRTTYGMTETASMVTLSDIWTDPPSEAVHAGRAFEGVDIDERDGRLLIRSRSLGEGLADAGGWLHTSDRGYVDENGRWVISGRMDRVIISGGENLDPDRIERAVRSLEGIEECMVVAVPNVRYGQRPVAFVSGPGSILTRVQLAARLSDVLVSFEIPDAFHPMPSLKAGQTKWSRSDLEELAKSLHQG